VGSLIEQFGKDAPGLLRRYAEALRPWAERVARRMLSEVAARDLDAWQAVAAELSGQLRADLRTAAIGGRVRELLAEQVDLITSIPTEAAERVHKAATAALSSGARAAELAEAIQTSTQVTRSRALLIARTETSRASTVVMQARAEAIGSTHYIWRTARDQDVRPGHAAMEGKTCAWASPPAVREGSRIMHFHPGEIWNCRCYPEPIIADPYAPVVQGRRRGA